MIIREIRNFLINIWSSRLFLNFQAFYSQFNHEKYLPQIKILFPTIILAYMKSWLQIVDIMYDTQQLQLDNKMHLSL